MNDFFGINVFSHPDYKKSELNESPSHGTNRNSPSKEPLFADPSKKTIAPSPLAETFAEKKKRIDKMEKSPNSKTDTLKYELSIL